MADIRYRLVRSKRKSVALVVSRNAEVIIRAPLRTPVDYIEKFFLEKIQWVERAIERVKTRIQESERRYEEGECFFFLGEHYPIRISEKSKRPLIFDGENFVFSQASQFRARRVFLEWYRREAKKILSERVKFFAKKYSIPVQSVKVNDAKTRWGSCSEKGSLNFSFRLIMAPMSVVDYVVIHELAHIRHRNHSRLFWKAVGEMFPGYEKEKRWLKKNGHLLGC